MLWIWNVGFCCGGFGQYFWPIEYSEVSSLGFIIYSVSVPPIDWSRRLKVLTIGGHISLSFQNWYTNLNLWFVLYYVCHAYHWNLDFEAHIYLYQKIGPSKIQNVKFAVRLSCMCLVFIECLWRCMTKPNTLKMSMNLDDKSRRKILFSGDLITQTSKHPR